MAQGCLKCLKYTMCVANFLCFVRTSQSSSTAFRVQSVLECPSQGTMTVQVEFRFDEYRLLGLSESELTRKLKA